MTLDDLPEDLGSWAAGQTWTALRAIQEITWNHFNAPASEDRDLVVCAPTATGKTEAVFLPLVAEMADWPEAGFDILYICPLKALIDQQAVRLQSLLKVRGRSVTAWHGEARRGREQAKRQPQGLLVITPESLESILRAGPAATMFTSLKAIVIDELHAFFDNPRGVQIIAQLARIDRMVGRKVRRIGLSATLSDDVEPVVRAFLRPAEPDRVVVLKDDTAITQIDYELCAFTDGPDPQAPDQSLTAREALLNALRTSVAEPMLAPHTAVSKTLVFCNARATVEWCATELAKPRSEDNAGSDLSRLVFPHHGSLDSKKRKAAEAALKDATHSALVVSSPTLELGLDIGDIERVVQIDPGPSVSSLRQRLGRSGRRAGKISRLTMMVRETAIEDGAHPLACLHVALFQSLAQLNLVQAKRFEPPEGRALNLSTFLQQGLSMSAGGADWPMLEEVLIDAGPFQAAVSDYRDLLERLSRPSPTDPGLVNLDEPLFTAEDAAGVRRFTLNTAGQALVERDDFGAAFFGGRQYAVRAGAETLGSIPAGHSLRAGDPLFFAGRRWVVAQVLEKPPTVFLRPSGGGRPPRFAGAAIAPSSLVVETMRGLYAGEVPLPQVRLDPTAQRLVTESREAFAQLDLATNPVLAHDDDVLLFPWAGSRVQGTLIAALRQFGLSAAPANIAVVVIQAKPDVVREALRKIGAGAGMPSVEDLARSIKVLRLDKHDRRLGPYLQRRNYASARFDIDGVVRTAKAMVAAQP
ncbi:ATP-dependent RNA helicase DbpA [compost metagenome]